MLVLNEFLYPELRLFAADERVCVLHEAKNTSFDALELFGMAAGLVIVTALTRYASTDFFDADQRFVSALLNFIVALPLLALVLGPFLIRRSRRGLRAEFAKRAARLQAHPH